VRQHADVVVDGFVAHETFVADFDADRVEEDDWIAGVRGLVLPFLYLFQDGASDG